MNVVYSVTADYIPKIFPSLLSLVVHEPNVHVYLVTEKDAVELPSKIKRLMTYGLTVINISDQTDFPKHSVNYDNAFTYINLLKVCYASILPVDKVIHLDADTIINGRLFPLWETDLTGKWFAACPEYRGRYKPFGETYYNMGVAVINLAQMRADQIEKKLVDYLNSFRQPFADQDAWNYYALKENKAVPFPIRFNENFATGYTDDPAIIHFCGSVNWWTSEVMFRKEYLDKYK